MGKYSEETKLAVVKDYCSGTAGLKVVARRHDVDVTSLRKWVAGYRSHGAASVREKVRATYSLKFKLSVLRRMRDEGLSYRQAAALFDIRNFNIIATWERTYDQGGLEALSPHASLRRKKMTKPQTTEAPRVFRRLFCLSHAPMADPASCS
ncbi:transposase [Paraburkholderia sp. RCC_158]|uniref:transposase n=1 Tax=Paraburkholderia sp. RCC_158 TaxID=3239220 RepID=UPI0035265827